MSDSAVMPSRIAPGGPAAGPRFDRGMHPGGIIAFLLVLVAGLGYAVVSLVADMNAVHQEPLAIGAFVLLGLALLIALGFEFVNGFHDTANAVATVIYTHSMPPLVAVIWSGFFNFLGVLLSSGAVAYAIVTLLPVELILQVGSRAGYAMIFALLIAAILWNLGTWAMGLPNSSSHELIGSLQQVPAGATSNVRNDMYLATDAIRLLPKSGASLSEGDTKTLKSCTELLNDGTRYIPGWVKVCVALALGLGPMVGWKRIVVTVGERIGKTHLTYAQGASAEIVAAGRHDGGQRFRAPDVHGVHHGAGLDHDPARRHPDRQHAVLRAPPRVLISVPGRIPRSRPGRSGLCPARSPEAPPCLRHSPSPERRPGRSVARPGSRSPRRR
jgi:Phosphate transporter family